MNLIAYPALPPPPPAIRVSHELIDALANPDDRTAFAIAKQVLLRRRAAAAQREAR